MPLILLFLLLFTAPSGAHAAASAAPPPPVQASDILPYLERVIGWSRAIATTDQLADNSREALLKDKLHQNSTAILQKSFAFARAQAVITESAPDSANAPKAKNDTQSRRQRLEKASADADQHVADLQSQLSQPALTDAQREKLAGALKLAQARQSLLQTMLGIANSEDEGSGALPDQINALARTVLSDAPAKIGKEEASAETPVVKPPLENSGIFSLSDSLLSLSRKKDAIDNLLKRTEKLTDTTHTLRDVTRAGLRDALAQGDALKTGSDDAAGMAAYRQSVDALVGHYKELSAVIIPLGEMNILLGNTAQILQDWDRMIAESWSRLFHRLMIRIAVLALSIAVPLICSVVAHRAIQRYATDSQMRKQLDMARRVLLIVLLIVVIAANFMTEFGSLVTFAGFLTAGLAVGLQSVLVSLVAHSLYFGRYGVHTGDRIKVADVTGEVIQLGMLRLYMKELKETDKGLVPTGKIVAFPNSVLFQPAAFYKYGDDQK